MSKSTTKNLSVLALLAIAAFFVAPSTLAQETSGTEQVAAAAIDIKACFQNSIKKCCDVAANVSLTKTCTSDDLTWVCVGQINSNPFIDSTIASKDGLQFSRTTGSAECKYTKPECGQFAGSCALESAETVASCTTSVAAGQLCESPDLLVETPEGTLDFSATASLCHQYE